MTQTSNEVFDETVAQRTALAGVLRGLPEAEWERPSLCAGWRIKEAVAHIELPFRYSAPRFLLQLLRSRGRFDAMSDRLARRDAARYSAEELVDFLEANLAHPWRPPGGGQLGALSHDVIHGLDVTEALALPTVSPPDRIRTVLEAPRLVDAFKVDLHGVRLTAIDTEYAVGDAGAATLPLPAKDVLLVVTGRRPVPGRL